MEAAGRGTLAIGNVAPAERPETGWRQLVPVMLDAGALQAVGAPIMVTGRPADPDVATEATINEEASVRLSVGVGDELLITPYRSDEFDLAGEGAAAPGGEQTTVTVVGITRRPSDLVGRLGGTSIYEDTSAVTVGPAWWDQIDGDASVYGIVAAVLTAPGSTNEDVIALIRDRWPAAALAVRQRCPAGHRQRPTDRPRRDRTPGTRAVPGRRSRCHRRAAFRGPGDVETVAS